RPVVGRLDGQLGGRVGVGDHRRVDRRRAEAVVPVPVGEDDAHHRRPAPAGQLGRERAQVGDGRAAVDDERAAGAPDRPQRGPVAAIVRRVPVDVGGDLLEDAGGQGMRVSAPATRRKGRPVSDLLEGTSAVDVHCHGWRSDVVAAAPQRGFLDRITMLGMCLVSSGLEDEGLRQILELTTDTSPIAVAMADHRTYLRRLWADAGVDDLIMDDGYPLPRIDGHALGDEVGLQVHRVCRIEPIITDVRDAAGSYSELADAFTAGLEEAVADGSIAFKSVIAYRTGLDVAEWGRDDCEAAFTRWRADGWQETREHAKPVRDALLWR